MPGMQMPTTQQPAPMNAAGMYLMNMASGTAINPQSWRMPMLMPRVGSWNLMLMGQAFAVDTQQTGPRGRDKFFSTNWFMASAEHRLWGGSFMFDTMLSLEPATITNRSYPLLFQTGETAFGRPLVDAQHPHDFVMALGAHYAHRIGDSTMLQIYYAPVGDPALGPVAFPHRASAAELPQAPLGHHWQDSTHIANNVLTMDVRHDWFRFEASGFYGTEPNENRWNIDWGPMNSYSGRLSILPSRNWLFQVSAGHIVKPERQEEGNVVRTTASASYTREGWSTSAIWGRSHGTNSYLIETVYPLRKRNFLTGRVERVDKDELSVPGTHRIGAFTAGYTRDVAWVRNVEMGVGANVTGYAVPSALQPSYGDHPWGVNVYLRIRLKPQPPH
jgi:hypothetical protein